MGIEVLLMAALAVTPVVFVGGLVGVGFYLRDQRVKAWQAVAQRLGLRYENDTIHGVLDGQYVRAFQESRGAGKSRTVYTIATATLVPAFDLGLGVHRHGFLSTVGEWVGMKDIAIGDPTFDAKLVVRGDEASRVQALFAHPPLRAALENAHKSGARFTLVDSGFRIETTGAASGPWVEYALRVSALVTRSASDARPRVPVASVLAPHRALWAEYAETVGMTGIDTPLSMSGRMDGAAVFVSASRVGALEYGLDVRVNLERPLGIGLVVQPSGSVSFLSELFGGQDLKVGDPAFDQRFVVKATNRHALAAILDATARRLVLELAASTGEVQLLDDAVIVKLPRFDADPSVVPRLVTRARSIANRLTENAATLGTAPRGPYR
jgi:hypothetical protein